MKHKSGFMRQKGDLLLNILIVAGAVVMVYLGVLMYTIEPLMVA